MKLNVEKILGNLKEIDEAIEQLTGLKAISKDDFIKSMEHKYIAYAGFIILTEAVIDTCYHISAKSFKKAPTTYAECFEVLKKNDILDPETADALSDMARFRNLLIHRYKKIDYNRVYDYISESLKAIYVFKEKIKSLIESV